MNAMGLKTSGKLERNVARRTREEFQGMELVIDLIMTLHVYELTSQTIEKVGKKPSCQNSDMDAIDDL